MTRRRHTLFATLSLFGMVLPLGPTVDAGKDRPLDDVAPVVSINGGSEEHRRTVLDAVARFAATGLTLPDLDIRLHHGKLGCQGKQGLFHRGGAVGVIDLCYPGEFLTLHELGHAWEDLNLDDDDRLVFMQLTGAPTWRSTDVTWRKRGAERAANVIANGLLSLPLETVESHTVWFAQFEELTGITSPRVNEVRPSSQPSNPTRTAEQASPMAAFATWRAASG
ncbi:MAG: hypothetical protein ABIP17_13860 [Ilumatobacteraceae bacterium]